MDIILEGRAMTDRVSTHSHLLERLELPEYYGRNLDALYDVLTDMASPVQITLRDPAAVTEQLGRYGEALLSTMQEAAENNPNLTFILA